MSEFWHRSKTRLLLPLDVVFSLLLNIPSSVLITYAQLKIRRSSRSVSPASDTGQQMAPVCVSTSDG